MGILKITKTSIVIFSTRHFDCTRTRDREIEREREGGGGERGNETWPSDDEEAAGKPTQLAPSPEITSRVIYLGQRNSPIVNQKNWDPHPLHTHKHPPCSLEEEHSIPHESGSRTDWNMDSLQTMAVIERRPTKAVP